MAKAIPTSSHLIRSVIAFILAVGLGAHAFGDTAPDPTTPATVSADGLPTWQINGVVWSQVVVNNIVYATGSFSKARPPGVSPGGAGEINAQNIFAYDLVTGKRVAWFNHSLNGQGLAITASPNGSRIYVGGDFTAVDGVARAHVASFKTTTGALDATFAPNVNGQIKAVAASDAAVYVGGQFNSANGVSRRNLAALGASNGLLLPWAPTVDNGKVWSMVLSPDRTRVVVGGSFTTINGLPAYGMGSVDATLGVNLPWAANLIIRNAGVDGAITSLRADNTRIYGSAYSFRSGTNPQTNFEGTFAADPTTGLIIIVNDCHGDTYDVLPLGLVLYSVGHAYDCTWVGGFPDTNPRVRWQRALAQTIFPTRVNTGPDSYGWNYAGLPASSILHWFPQLSTGSYTGMFQGPWSLAGSGDYIALGGEFLKVNGVAQQGLVRMAVRTVAPNKRGPSYTTNPARPVPATTASAGTDGSVHVSFGSAWDYDNESLKYELFRNGIGAPVYTTQIRSNFWTLPTTSYTDTGLAPGSKVSYQVRITDPFGNTLLSPVSNSVIVRCDGPLGCPDPLRSVPGSAKANLIGISAIQASRSEVSAITIPERNYVDPEAPAKSQPVLRKGKKSPNVTVPASSAPLATSAAVRYSDRVLVSIARIAGGTENGSGPGVFPGRPHTAFTIKITNHSPAALDLNQVVISTRYGSPPRLAAAVYNDASAKDFSGILKPGSSATATYLFAIPPEHTDDIVLFVDFDNTHAPAIFKAAATR
jgi:large repetitive protein